MDASAGSGTAAAMGGSPLQPLGGAVGALGQKAAAVMSPQVVNAVDLMGKQTATLFLGAVAFSVAMAWNSWVQSLISLWTPKDQDKQKAAQVKYNLYAALALTMIAVLLAWILKSFYGKSVASGQAQSYGLG